MTTPTDPHQPNSAPTAPITKSHLREEAERKLSWVSHEFIRGIDFLKTYEKSVTFFGSARFKPDHPAYQKARFLGARIAKELGYAVVTGGGPGIMEAGNRGAREVGGNSLGLSIRLPMEQITNPFITNELGFYYFFSRKIILSFAAEAYLYFPGGYGTLDELFEILTLIQTKKIERIPVILVGVEFWAPLDAFIKKTLLEQYESISPEDLDLYHITDDDDEILKIVKAAPIRN